MRTIAMATITVALIVALMSACAPSANEADVTPPPVPPTWLTAEESQRVENGSAEEANKIDVFVAFASIAPKEVDRVNSVAATALLLKYSLHQLYYPVDFAV